MYKQLCFWGFWFDPLYNLFSPYEAEQAHAVSKIDLKEYFRFKFDKQIKFVYTLNPFDA